jgi:hypothetical protein
MHDPTDHAPIIDPMRAATAARQKRLYPRPFRVAEPSDPVHRKLPAK